MKKRCCGQCRKREFGHDQKRGKGRKDGESWQGNSLADMPLVDYFIIYISFPQVSEGRDNRDFFFFFLFFLQHFLLVHAERHEICEKSKVERPKRRKSLGTVLGTCRRKQFVGQSMSPRHNQVYVLYSFFISTGSHLVGNRPT